MRALIIFVMSILILTSCSGTAATESVPAVNSDSVVLERLERCLEELTKAVSALYRFGDAVSNELRGYSTFAPSRPSLYGISNWESACSGITK